MQPAETGKAIMTDLKQGIGADVYPAYALNTEMVSKIWDICREFTHSTTEPSH